MMIIPRNYDKKLKPSIAILGTRGIPAQHGGFETFAEQLALYLAEKGWEVIVHCPAFGASKLTETLWHGIRLLHVPVRYDDALNTIIFDWRSTVIAAREGGTVLNLGYGTALFGFLYRLRGARNIVNMDGIEWRREKWSLPERAWLYLNERLACLFAHHLIADHPEIARHLATRVSTDKITMIPYGANPVTSAETAPLAVMGLEPGKYVLVVARPDPDNSILEIVEAFSAWGRGLRLVVLGNYQPATVPYHKLVMDAAGDEVLFPGGIYETQLLETLRFHARLYIHGHRVGGTNPSLVEALAAGNPVMAHDNQFNRWVAGDGAVFFQGAEDCRAQLDNLLDDEERLTTMAASSRARHRQGFLWEQILETYEKMLLKWQ